MQGTMIWLNPAKYRGFSRTDEGERLPVDEMGLEPGQVVGALEAVRRSRQWNRR